MIQSIIRSQIIVLDYQNYQVTMSARSLLYSCNISRWRFTNAVDIAVHVNVDFKNKTFINNNSMQYIFYLLYFLSMLTKYIISTNVDAIIKRKMTLWKVCKIQCKNCYQVLHVQMIIQILKNITNILELAVEVGKRNCKRLYNFISNGKIFKRYTFNWDGIDTMLLVIS